MRNGEYTLIKVPKAYPGKRYRNKFAYEHHVVWWQHTGQIVPNGFLIHHINGNKRDNTFENLALVDWKKHTQQHSKPVTLVEVICSQCSVAFTRERRNYAPRKQSGQKNFYCGRSCMGRHQKHHLKRSGVEQPGSSLGS